MYLSLCTKIKQKFMDGGKMGWMFQVRNKVGMSDR